MVLLGTVTCGRIFTCAQLFHPYYFSMNEHIHRILEKKNFTPHTQDSKQNLQLLYLPNIGAPNLARVFAATTNIGFGSKLVLVV